MFVAGGLDVMKVARGDWVSGSGGGWWIGGVRAVAIAVWGIAACGGKSRLSEAEGKELGGVGGFPLRKKHVGDDWDRSAEKNKVMASKS